MDESIHIDKEMSDQDIVAGYLESGSNLIDTEVKSDNELKLSDKKSLIIHNEAFSKLLDNYVDYSGKALCQKTLWKRIFFWMSVAIMGVTAILMAIGIVYLLCHGAKELHVVVSYIGVIAPFMTSIFIIPKTIAKYLFASQEEQNMVQIVSRIQKYDVAIRRDTHGNK